VLPRGRNFGPKRKRAEKNSVGPENLGPNFTQIYPKRAEKVANFIEIFIKNTKVS
jgi:hypothetical protein